MNVLKRLYFQYMALNGDFSLGTLHALCEVYEYDLDENKDWQSEVAWNMKWCKKGGQTTDRELRRVLSIFFINNSFVCDKAFAKIMACRKRVLPLFMACLKKREKPLTKAESEVIAKLSQEDFERLPKPLHPWIEKELLISGDGKKVFWYCGKFVLSTDAEMCLILLAAGNSYDIMPNCRLDYKRLLLEYVGAHKEALLDDFSFDLLCKKDGLNEVKDMVLSRRADA